MSVAESVLQQEDLIRVASHQMTTGLGFEEALLELKLLSPDRLEQLRSEQAEFRIPLGEVLRRRGVLSEQQLSEHLAQYRSEADDPAKLVHMMRHVEMLAQLPDQLLHDLAGRGTLKHRDANETVYSQGQTSDRLYFIESGLVRLTHNPGNETVELGTCHSGQAFGLAAISGGDPRLETATTVMRSYLWSISAEDIRETIKLYPAAVESFTQHLGGHLRSIATSLTDRTKGFETNIHTIILESGTDATQLADELIRSAAEEIPHAVQIVHCDPALVEPDVPSVEALIGPEAAGRVFVMRVAGLHPRNDLERTLKWLHRESEHIPVLFFLISMPAPNDENRREAEESAELLLKNSRRTLVLTPGIDPTYITGVQQSAVRVQLVAKRGEVEPNTFARLQKSCGPTLSPITFKPDSLERSVRSATRAVLGKEVGLVLGGGGAKGATHFGILDAFEQAGIPIDVIAASSSGNMAAAPWAWGLPTEQAIEAYVEAYGKRKVKYPDWTLPFHGHLTRGNPGKVFLRSLMGDGFTFDCMRAYLPVAVDMNSGQDRVVAGIETWRAAFASMAIPGLLPMVEHGDALFADGALANNVPSSHVRSYGADLIVSVNISPTPEHTKFNRRSVPSNMMRSAEVMMHQTTPRHTKYTDVTIQPPVATYGMFDFAESERFIEIGREAANEKLPEIRYLLRKQSLRFSGGS